MDSNNYVTTTTPIPFLVRCKRYYLLAAAAAVVLLSGYAAFVQPFLFSTEFNKAQVVFTAVLGFFFLGLVVWASKENDKDKVWGELLAKRLSTVDRSLRDKIEIADLLPEDNPELLARLSVPLAADFISKDTPGRQLNHRTHKIASALSHGGYLIVCLESAQLVLLWLIGKFESPNVDVTVALLIAGAISLIPYELIKRFNQSKPLFQSTAYARIDRDSAKHRRYKFYKYNRQILLDNGFKELFDARYDSTICTFFASSNRDMIAEVGIFEYGRLYYGVRTVAEDGTMYESRSGGLRAGNRDTPESVQLCIFERMPIENLLREHAVGLAKRLKESKSRLVILKDQVIDRLFLGNRFRYPA